MEPTSDPRRQGAGSHASVRAKSAPLRVLWVIKALGHGGAEKLLLNLAESHDQNTVKLDCAYLIRDDDLFVKAMQDAGVNCLQLGHLGRPRPWVIDLVSTLRNGRYDVVHVHSPALASITRPILHLFGRRPRPLLVTTEHNVWPSYHPVTRVMNHLTSPLDDHSIAVSEAVRGTMRPAVRRSCHTIIHGVPVGAIQAEVGVDRGTGRSPERFGSPARLLVVANLRHDKDYPNLIAAIEILATTRTDFALRIVGKGPLREEIEGRATHLIERGLVEMLGPRSDVVQLMADSDILVLSSSKEGLPVVIMEALAAGLPVVSTAVGGIPELVGDSGAAMLVTPGDPAALAGALSGLLGNQSRLSEMSRACLLASEQVNIDHAARRIESLYQVRQ